MGRRNEKDFDLQKYSLATLKLVKYLQEDTTGAKIAVLKSMIGESASKQLVFGHESYKVYKDLSIEIPIDFDHEVLDSFFEQVFHEQGIYTNKSEEEEMIAF